MIKIFKDTKADMIKVVSASGRVVFEGNYWDIDLESLLKLLGIDYNSSTYQYED